MKKICLLLLGLILLPALSLPVSATELDSLKAHADNDFAQGKYEEAARLYNSVADSVASVDVYYNLGCTYYRLDDMAHSILWFERAQKLDPADEDISANLELARSKTIDRITAKHDFVVLDIFLHMACMLNLGQWAWMCLSCFVLALVAFAVFLFSDNIKARKCSFFAAIIMLLFCLAGNACALYQRHTANQHTGGVIMTSVVTVKSTPSDNGNDLFLLHEGTRIEVRDNSLKDWAEVEIADGKVGWIQKKHYVVI